MTILNLVQTPGGTTYAYDVANRLISNGATYNPRNQRIFNGTYFYLYTPSGKMLGKYTVNWSAYTPSQPSSWVSRTCIAPGACCRSKGAR